LRLQNELAEVKESLAETTKKLEEESSREWDAWLASQRVDFEKEMEKSIESAVNKANEKSAKLSEELNMAKTTIASLHCKHKDELAQLSREYEQKLSPGQSSEFQSHFAEAKKLMMECDFSEPTELTKKDPATTNGDELLVSPKSNQLLTVSQTQLNVTNTLKTRHLAAASKHDKENQGMSAKKAAAPVGQRSSLILKTKPRGSGLTRPVNRQRSARATGPIKTNMNATEIGKDDSIVMGTVGGSRRRLGEINGTRSAAGSRNTSGIKPATKLPALRASGLKKASYMKNTASSSRSFSSSSLGMR